MKCPECKVEIASQEVEDILNHVLIEELPGEDLIPMIKRVTSEDERLKLHEFLETLNIVTFQCGNMMEVVEGEIDPNIKDLES